MLPVRYLNEHIEIGGTHSGNCMAKLGRIGNNNVVKEAAFVGCYNKIVSDYMSGVKTGNAAGTIKKQTILFYKITGNIVSFFDSYYGSGALIAMVKLISGSNLMADGKYINDVGLALEEYIK